MRTSVIAGLIVLSGLLAWTYPPEATGADDDGSRVTILAPRNGETLPSGDVDVKFELRKGSQAYHAHVFVDGQYQTAFQSPLMGLKPGAHEIRVVAATAEHRLLQASDRVRFDVR